MGTVDGAAVLRPTTSPAPPPVAMTLDCNENHVKGLFYKYSYGGYILGRRIRELYGMLPVSATEMAQIWELADSDRDGKLSIDEFINFSRFLSTKLHQVSYGMDAVRVLYVDFFSLIFFMWLRLLQLQKEIETLLRNHETLLDERRALLHRVESQAKRSPASA